MLQVRALMLTSLAMVLGVVSSACASESSGTAATSATTGAAGTAATSVIAATVAAAIGTMSTGAASDSTALVPVSMPDSVPVSTGPESAVPVPVSISVTVTVPVSPPAESTVPISVTGPLDCGEMVSGNHQVDVGGVARGYVVDSPPGLDRSAAAQRAPVIVLFHGFNSNAEQVLATSGLDHLGPDHGVVVVAPQGIGSPTSWHIGDPSVGDTEFTDRVLELVRASPCIDPAKIWLAGFSAGSAWTGVYGCAHTEGIAGLLMHSGLAPPICPAASTPDLMIVHGTADPVVPFGGGAQTVDTASVQLRSVPESTADWASKAGCDALPAITSAGEHVEIAMWSGCVGGRTVSLQAVDGLGHIWSGGPGAPGLLNPGCVLVQRLTGAADPVAACLR